MAQKKTAPPPQSQKLTAQQIAQYAYNAGFRGADLVKAVAIAIAESGGNPKAYNPELAAGTKSGSGSRGLWQIYGTAHPQYNNPTVFDPQANANAAYQVYREAGNKFTPWTTWTKGVASQIIPTLPKFQIDSSPAARSQTTTKAVSQMTGTIGETTGTAAGIATPQSTIANQIQTGVDGAITSIKNAVAGKTAEGAQRELFDTGIYITGVVLVFAGLIFLFIKSDAGQATIQTVKDTAATGAKVAAAV